MKTKSQLSVGHIHYLNCVPCFHYLKEFGFTGKLVSGVPSALNRLLQQGEVDISPSSSFEYARNWHDYQLLPGHSISSVGKVESVLLFSPCELAGLEGRPISLTGESATSINLLRVLLREYYGLTDVRDVVASEPVESCVEQGEPTLLIGDRALRMAAKKPAGMLIFDLGELWYQQTGLPFVFALWMVRRSACSAHRKELLALSGQLTRSYQKSMEEPAKVAAEYVSSSGLSVEQIEDYWQSLDYRLNPEHIEGVRLFFQLCHKYQLLEEEPCLEFFES